jgi:hypothetical protein
LSACGGGGSGEPSPSPANPPPAGPTADDLGKARASGVEFVLAAGTRTLEISWKDTFDGELGYRIETLSGSVWVAAESLPPSDQPSALYEWTRIIDHSSTYRVVARRGIYDVPLENLAGHTDVTVAPAAATPPSLELDHAEPVGGAVQVTVSAAGDARSAEYFADASRIRKSTAAPTFAVPWDTRELPDGAHSLIAKIEQSDGGFIEVRRSVLVDNPNVAVSLHVGSDNAGIRELLATASADSGVHDVEFFANGQSLGVAAQHSSNTWTQSWDTRSLAAGDFTLRVVATDNAGEQADASQTVTIDRLPVVTLESPVDGAIVPVAGVLPLRGSLADDLPGASVEIYFGDILVLDTAQRSFSFDYPLASFPAGQYTVTIVASDSSGQIATQTRAVILSASSFTHDVVERFSGHATLLTSDAGALLYKRPDGAVVRRDTAGQTTVLQASADIGPLPYLDAASAWSLSGTRATTVGLHGSAQPEVLLFDASGAVGSIAYTPGTFDVFVRSSLDGPWHIYGVSQIHLRNQVTAATHDVPGDLFRGHAFSAAPNAERMFFTRDTGAVNGWTVIDVFEYRLADRVVTALTTGSSQNTGPKTDGDRVAWASVALPSHPALAELVVAPATNPTSASVRAQSVRGWDLDDGWLAWVEDAAGTHTLKADDGITSYDVSSSVSTELYSTSSGNVIFGESGKLYAWNSTQGRRLLLDSLPTQVLQDDGIAFLAIGLTQTTIYRVAL